MNFNPITVIIPTYNRAKTIAYCLDSVINQTLSPQEIIVVDDCSLDDTLQVVKNYNYLLVKIKLLQKNSGSQKARNEGIKAPTTEWFQTDLKDWFLEQINNKAFLDNPYFNGHQLRQEFMDKIKSKEADKYKWKYWAYIHVNYWLNNLPK